MTGEVRSREKKLLVFLRRRSCRKRSSVGSGDGAGEEDREARGGRERERRIMTARMGRRDLRGEGAKVEEENNMLQKSQRRRRQAG